MTNAATPDPDPAAVLAIAMALVEEGSNCENLNTSFSVSETYAGYDVFMREAMRVGREFETWACQHVEFDEMEEVWPYFLEGFQHHALRAVGTESGRAGEGMEELLSNLRDLDAEAWPKIAAVMKLPLKAKTHAVSANDTPLPSEPTAATVQINTVIVPPDQYSPEGEELVAKAARAYLRYNGDGDRDLPIVVPPMRAALRALGVVSSSTVKPMKRGSY